MRSEYGLAKSGGRRRNVIEIPAVRVATHRVPALVYARPNPGCTPDRGTRKNTRLAAAWNIAIEATSMSTKATAGCLRKRKSTWHYSGCLCFGLGLCSWPIRAELAALAHNHKENLHQIFARLAFPRHITSSSSRRSSRSASNQNGSTRQFE